MSDVVYLENNIISFVRGDTFSFLIELLTTDDLPYELKENDKLVFTVKKTSRQSNVLIQKVINSSMEVTIEHDDTADLPYGKYVYDVQLTNELGTKTVIEPTSFILKEEVNWGE